jgi:DNA-binding NarL/FixJ family response regulator
VIRVVIADDQALLRGSFSLLVGSDPDLTVVGEAADGAAAVDVVRRTVPDVVLMDLRMPVLDGIEATRRICADPALSGVRVLVLTMFDGDEYVHPALRAGASGFLLKDTPPADLMAAIRTVAAGEGMLSPTVTRRLIADFAARGPAAIPAARRIVHSGLDSVTGREREVLTLVARGLSNGEVAQRLGLSLPTVKTHVSHLLTKLGVRDRVHLVIAAYESGLIAAGDTG